MIFFPRGTLVSQAPHPLLASYHKMLLLLLSQHFLGGPKCYLSGITSDALNFGPEYGSSSQNLRGGGGILHIFVNRSAFFFDTFPYSIIIVNNLCFELSTVFA